MTIDEALGRIRDRLEQLDGNFAARSSGGAGARLVLDCLGDVIDIVEGLAPPAAGAEAVLAPMVRALALQTPEDTTVGGAGADSLSGPDSERMSGAEHLLDLERSQLQCIFSATTNLVLVTDPDGLVTHLNPAAEQFFAGYAWSGAPFWRLLELPGDRLQDVLAAYAPDAPHEIYHAGAGQWFNLRLVPLDPGAGPVSGFTLILNDITWLVDSRQHLETLVADRTRALANSEKMLRLIFQSAGNGILLLSDDYRIVKANQRIGQIHACDPDALLGMDARDLTDISGRLTFMSCVAALSGEESTSAEIQVRRADGSMLLTSFMVTRVEIDGRIYWPVIVRDISRQKALESRLRMEKQQVEEMNVTLRNVMKSVDSDRREFENNLARRIRSHLLPALDRIRSEASETVRASYLDLVREQLIGLTGGFTAEIDANLLKLSKTEIRICQFIQAGCSTKDICDAMNLAFETVQTHRKNIRRKLGLRGKTVNLHSYLIGRRSLGPAPEDA